MRAPIIVAALANALGIAALAGPLAGQEWRASALGGRIRSSLDPAASERLVLGLQYDGPATGLRLSGGVPLRAEEPWSGAASAWTRLAARRQGFLAGVDVAGSALLSVDRAADGVRRPTGLLPDPFDPSAPVRGDRSGHAFAAQAMPVVGYEGARVQLHARAGVSRYSATFGDQRAVRSVQLADLQVTLAPTASLALVPVIRHFRAADEDPSLYAGVSAVTTSRLGSLWASVGRWSGGAGEGTPWSVGGRLPLHALVSLEGAVRHDTFDPLYLQPTQTSWSVGLSVRLGGAARSIAPPVPAAYVDGRATVRLPASDARTQPSIAGDFNGWAPAPMTREGDHWTYTVALSPGVYHYAFVGGDGTWFVPEGVPGRRDDGMGGHVAVLVVP
ncbi:MAG TPA: glycogen-binding domain-containing protein [Gemmatimonadales bacterium]